MRLTQPTILLALGLTLGAAQTARAELALPAPSLKAKVMMTVGLTDIEVEYSAPAKRGREVWGKLVPYGQIWRTGANANTLIRFSEAVKIGGTQVEAGTYSVHSIPGKDAWTVVINRKTDGWGSESYDEKQDVVRASVKPSAGPQLERMRFVFEQADNAGVKLVLQWAGVSVPLPIELMTTAQVAKGVEAELGGQWRAPAQAARYYLEQEKKLDRAMELVNASIALKPTWYNQWTKARILNAQGKNAEARPLVEKALASGDDSGAFRFYSQQMKAALKDWK